MVLGKLIIHIPKSEARSLPSTICKNNFKGIKELTIRAKVIKLLEENLGERLHAIRFVNGFLNMAPTAQATKEKNR